MIFKGSCVGLMGCFHVFWGKPKETVTWCQNPCPSWRTRNRRKYEFLKRGRLSRLWGGCVPKHASERPPSPPPGAVQQFSVGLERRIHVLDPERTAGTSNQSSPIFSSVFITSLMTASVPWELTACSTSALCIAHLILPVTLGSGCHCTQLSAGKLSPTVVN